MAELGSTNIHGDLSTTGDHNVGGNSLVYGAQTVQGNQDTKGTLTEKGQRVFSPNNRNISTSVGNSSSTIYAAAIAVKNAYDKGVQAYNLAAGKLATNGKAYDSTRLGGKFNSTGLVRTLLLSVMVRETCKHDCLELTTVMNQE